MNINTERRCYNKEMEVAKHSSLHSLADGIQLAEPKRRHLRDATHDYSKIYGWNLKKKIKGF